MPPPGVIPDSMKPDLAAFLRELPRLLADGLEGKHVLVHGGEVQTMWDTFEDGYQAGRELFGFGAAFIVQPVDPRYLEYPWPEDIMPRKVS